MFELTILTSFSSAHNLRGYNGACENLHGHNWRVEVSIKAEATASDGMVMDFKELKADVKEIIASLDHKYLNETPPFDKQNPTAELISRHIYQALKASLAQSGVSVNKVLVWESDNAGAAYYE
ncbi:MAG: 6-carboxytetrahydropterin synthase QueD [Deltaproteobacteria bacterium]|jgi:6-pyruvoyltetrahydropterin/6-carboxytetrahydropterin synthase